MKYKQSLKVFFAEKKMKETSYNNQVFAFFER